MSVTVKPYRNGGWEVDIAFQLPDGSRDRRRYRAPVRSKTAAQRWGEDRERHLLQHGRPQPNKEVPTLAEFKDRFLDGYARANRQKPSGVAAKETILNVHLVPRLGSKRLHAINNEDVQGLKHHLRERAPKTVNNVLTVLNMLLKKAVEWEVIERYALCHSFVADSQGRNGVLRLRRVRSPDCSSTESGQRSASHRVVGRRGGVAVRRDHRARVDRCGSRQAAALYPTIRVAGPRHGSEGRPV